MANMAGPAEVSREFADAINRGDVAGAVACWTHQAVFVAADGATARGGLELRARFEQLVQARARVEIAVTQIVVAGSAALGTTRTALSVGDAPAPMMFDGTVVYVHDGAHWRIAVDRIGPAV